MSLPFKYPQKFFSKFILKTQKNRDLDHLRYEFSTSRHNKENFFCAVQDVDEPAFHGIFDNDPTLTVEGAKF